MSPETFRTKVKTGFQMLPYHLQGKIIGHDMFKDSGLDGQGKSGEIYGWGGR